jgi:hypothetical protein
MVLGNAGLDNICWCWADGSSGTFDKTIPIPLREVLFSLFWKLLKFNFHVIIEYKRHTFPSQAA